MKEVEFLQGILSMWINGAGKKKVVASLAQKLSNQCLMKSTLSLSLAGNKKATGCYLTGANTCLDDR